MPKELFRIGGVLFYDDEIESLSNLKKDRFPMCGKKLIDLFNHKLELVEKN